MIELKAVDRIFTVGEQRVHALRHIDLHIMPGEYISIMGPSGSGKSTLLNIMGLLDRPNSGSYLFEQQEVSALSDNEQAKVRRERIGFVFQFFHLIPRLTAAENIELPLMLSGVPKSQRRPRVEEILESLGLSERAHHRPEQLSGGQRQRVAIGRATVTRPSLLLADEPTGNLDRATGQEMVTILEQLNEQGITLIVVTHDPELGQRAHRRLRMVDGEIVADIGKTT
ncbi:MAG: ABC transporter ATP-binding protein [Thiohalomonadaceae bacterium]